MFSLCVCKTGYSISFIPLLVVPHLCNEQYVDAKHGISFIPLIVVEQECEHDRFRVSF